MWNFYRRFLSQFSKVSSPFNPMLKNFSDTGRHNPSESQRKSFKDLKSTLSRPPHTHTHFHYPNWGGHIWFTWTNNFLRPMKCLYQSWNKSTRRTRTSGTRHSSHLKHSWTKSNGIWRPNASVCSWCEAFEHYVHISKKHDSKSFRNTMYCGGLFRFIRIMGGSRGGVCLSLRTVLPSTVNLFLNPKSLPFCPFAFTKGARTTKSTKRSLTFS